MKVPELSPPVLGGGGRRRRRPRRFLLCFLVSLLLCYSARPLTTGRPWSGSVSFSGGRTLFSSSKWIHHLAFTEHPFISPGVERQRTLRFTTASVAGSVSAILSGLDPGNFHNLFPSVSPLFCRRMRTLYLDAVRELGQFFEKLRIYQFSFADAVSSERYIQVIKQLSLSDLLSAAAHPAVQIKMSRLRRRYSSVDAASGMRLGRAEDRN